MSDDQVSAEWVEMTVAEIEEFSRPDPETQKQMHARLNRERSDQLNVQMLASCIERIVRLAVRDELAALRSNDH